MSDPSPTPSPAASLDGVTVRFGHRAALDGVTLTFAAGSFTAIVGANGSGKSTLLRALLGEPLTAGAVRVLGAVPSAEHTAWRARIGALPDGAPSWPDLLVADAVHYAARLRGVPPSDREGAVRRQLVDLALAPVAGTPVRALSRGQRQRLGWACALVHAPHLVLFDEPATGLDPHQLERAIALLGTHRDRGACVLVATHDLGGVAAAADRAVVLANGRVAHDVPRSATPDWVRLAYACPPSSTPRRPQPAAKKK